MNKNPKGTCVKASCPLKEYRFRISGKITCIRAWKKEETNYISSVLMFSLYRLRKDSRLIRTIIVYTPLHISLLFTRKWLRGFEGFLQALLLAMLQEIFISFLFRVVFPASAQLGQTSDYKSETAPLISYET